MNDNVEGNGNGKISFTIRELLSEIKQTLVTIDAKLDGKAEKSIVDNIERRVITMEAGRLSEQTFGNQLLKEFREGQTDLVELKAKVLILETTGSNKRNFDLLWIPIIANTVAVAAVIYFTIIHH